MSSSLAGKAFVVEGTLPAAGEVTRTLVERGARVLVVAADGAAAEALAARTGDGGLALAADLMTTEGVDALAAFVPIVLGRLDGAVLRCQGAAGRPATLAELDDAAWRRACASLVEAPARVVRELAPHLEEGGVIVLVEPPADGGATDVLLAALRVLVGRLDASAEPAAGVRLEVAAAGRDALLDALAG